MAIYPYALTHTHTTRRSMEGFIAEVKNEAVEDGLKCQAAVMMQKTQVEVANNLVESLVETCTKVCHPDPFRGTPISTVYSRERVSNPFRFTYMCIHNRLSHVTHKVTSVDRHSSLFLLAYYSFFYHQRSCQDLSSLSTMSTIRMIIIMLILIIVVVTTLIALIVYDTRQALGLCLPPKSSAISDAAGGSWRCLLAFKHACLEAMTTRTTSDSHLI